jgi:putative isomerase
VLSYVSLPYGFAVDLSLIDSDGVRVNRFLIGDRSEGAPLLHPGPHSYNGTYTDINVDGMNITEKYDKTISYYGDKTTILF